MRAENSTERKIEEVMSETILRQIEILTNAWDTISNIFIKDDEELSTKCNAILHELTKKILEKMDLYLNSGK